MPPLTSIKGTQAWDANILRRIWACCPLEKMAHLEACRHTDIKALATYLQGHTSDFANLRSLKLIKEQYGFGDEEEEEDEELEDAAREDAVSRVIAILAQGGAPKLEKLSIYHWQPAASTTAEVSAAFGKGTFPSLSSLDLDLISMDSSEFGTLMDGLQMHLNLSKLRLTVYVGLTPPHVARLASALMDKDGGLARLEDLHLTMVRREETHWGVVFQALADGAPCAGTLTTLHIAAEEVEEVTLGGLLHSFGTNAFPRLRSLDLSLEETLTKSWCRSSAMPCLPWLIAGLPLSSLI